VGQGAACAIAAASVSSTAWIAHAKFGLGMSLDGRMRRAGGNGGVVGWRSAKIDRLQRFATEFEEGV
jgi:hypothetical protein